jgi:hypothetical protein
MSADAPRAADGSFKVVYYLPGFYWQSSKYRTSISNIKGLHFPSVKQRHQKIHSLRTLNDQISIFFSRFFIIPIFSRDRRISRSRTDLAKARPIKPSPLPDAYHRPKRLLSPLTRRYDGAHGHQVTQHAVQRNRYYGTPFAGLAVVGACCTIRACVRDLELSIRLSVDWARAAVFCLLARLSTGVIETPYIRQ